MAEGDPVVDNPSTTDPGSWKDAVPKELRFNEGGVDALGKFESPDQVAKSYLELQKTMGSRVKLPSEESTPEELSSFYQRLGRPEKPDGYTLPEGTEIDPQVITPIMSAAHEAGISDKAFAKLVERYLNVEKQVQENNIAQINAETEAAEQALKSELGGGYDTFIEVTDRVFKGDLTPEDIRDEVAKKWTDAGFGRDPVMLKWMNSIGKGMLNDSFVKGDTDAPKLDADYRPQYPQSPELYTNMEGPEGEKARQWFTVNKGTVW
jgi:hypothetical protein